MSHPILISYPLICCLGKANSASPVFEYLQALHMPLNGIETKNFSQICLHYFVRNFSIRAEQQVNKLLVTQMGITR